LLEGSVALLELAQLGGLGLGDTRFHAVFDVGLLQPVAQRGVRDPEVLGDPDQRGLAFPGYPDDVLAEFGGIGLGTTSYRARKVPKGRRVQGCLLSEVR
jgi:hypothetical protein